MWRTPKNTLNIFGCVGYRLNLYGLHPQDLTSHGWGILPKQGRSFLTPLLLPHWSSLLPPKPSWDTHGAPGQTSCTAPGSFPSAACWAPSHFPHASACSIPWLSDLAMFSRSTDVAGPEILGLKRCNTCNTFEHYCFAEMMCQWIFPPKTGNMPGKCKCSHC